MKKAVRYHNLKSEYGIIVMLSLSVFLSDRHLHLTKGTRAQHCSRSHQSNNQHVNTSKSSAISQLDK